MVEIDFGDVATALKELGMRELKKTGFALGVGMVFLLLTGFGPNRGAMSSSG